jgi:hypothetical protein
VVGNVGLDEWEATLRYKWHSWRGNHEQAQDRQQRRAAKARDQKIEPVIEVYMQTMAQLLHEYEASGRPVTAEDIVGRLHAAAWHAAIGRTGAIMHMPGFDPVMIQLEVDLMVQVADSRGVPLEEVERVYKQRYGG